MHAGQLLAEFSQALIGHPVTFTRLAGNSLILYVDWQPGDAYGAEDGVLKATLNNGLRVIVVRNDLAPVVSTAVNYFVGADETPPGFPGTAHALEHMMFRGSPGLSATQLADIGSLIGGNFHANT